MNRTCKVGEVAKEPKYLSFHETERGARKILDVHFNEALADATSGELCPEYYREDVFKYGTEKEQGYCVNHYFRGDLTRTEYYYIEHRIVYP